jgi:hypothetical protein
MASCNCNRHENILVSDYYGSGCLLDYQEHEQNTIFINVRTALLIVDSIDYIEECTQCGKQCEIYIYGTWPDVSVSFDGATDLPIRAIVHGVDFHSVGAVVCNELSLGNFIYANYTTCHDYEECFIMYYPTGNIEQSGFKHYENIIVDGKPAVCCQTIDGKNYLLINSDITILKIETIHTSIYGEEVFKIGNGTLYVEEKSGRWKYTANPALKTKPAAAFSK